MHKHQSQRAIEKSKQSFHEKEEKVYNYNLSKFVYPKQNKFILPPKNLNERHAFYRSPRKQNAYYSSAKRVVEIHQYGTRKRRSEHVSDPYSSLGQYPDLHAKLKKLNVKMIDTYQPHTEGKWY